MLACQLPTPERMGLRQHGQCSHNWWHRSICKVKSKKMANESIGLSSKMAEMKPLVVACAVVLDEAWAVMGHVYG